MIWDGVILGLIVVSAWLLTRGIIPLLIQARLEDRPDARRSHQVPIPRGGGAAVIAVWLVASVFCIQLHPLLVDTDWVRGILFSGVCLAIVGFADDFHDLRPAVKFAAQVVVVACALVTLPQPNHLILLPVIALIILWWINLFNFMDGINGMATTQGIFFALGLAWLVGFDTHPSLSALGLMLAATGLGFLPNNFPRARVFLGDTGSLGMGAAIAALGYVAWLFGHVSFWQLLVLGAVFWVDATLTLAFRIVQGEQWYNPHRQHAYQRLANGAFSHGQVTTGYGLINAVVVVPAVYATSLWPDHQWLIAVVLLLLLSLGWWRIRKYY